MTVESLIEKIAKKHESLANPIRIHILSIVSALGEASWSKIKAMLESRYGQVNPNTLAFHIKKLIESDLISRSGSPESVTYVANIPKDLREELREVIEFYKKLAGGRA